MRLDGPELVNLTRHPANERSAACSPDGKLIAFISNRDSLGREIYLMDTAGNNQQKLTNNQRYCESIAWSPDGKKIAFTHYCPVISQRLSVG